MKNKYGIPEEKLNEIRKRDQTCIYCHKKMIEPSVNGQRRNWATIEHLNHLPPWDNPDTVAFCCWSCNSSRSDKKIIDWFKTSYCIDKNINYGSVAKPVRNYIENNEKL